jgi:hypothetical protein
MAKKTVTFEALYEFHRSIEAPPADSHGDPGLGALGLVILLDPPTKYGYAQTPFNTITFADLGVDGIHIGSVTNGDCPDPAAPVVLTIPMGGLIDVRSNYILGHDLYEFLCLGYHHGFDDLANLHLDMDATLARFRQPPSLTTSPYQDLAKYSVSVLSRLIERFELKPIPDIPRHFQELQETYYGLLELASDI